MINTKPMKTIALNRLNVLGMTEGTGLTAEQKITFLAELARLGYRITNPKRLDQVSDTFLLDYKHWLDILSKKKGGQVKYVPLFKNFPAHIPEDRSYFLKRVIGYLGNMLGGFEDGIVLQNGVKVPRWLFDVYEFGADPVTQMQSDELFALALKENEQKKGDAHVVWTDLTIAFEDELVAALKKYLYSLVYSKSSIKEALRADLYQLLSFFGANELAAERLVFKETKALVMKHFWEKKDYAAVEKLASSATDVLRMFAALTDTDVSLSEKIRFPKMNRAARKTVLATLEKSPNLPEDIRKYQGLWREIGRYVHPTEYAKTYPRTAQVFDALRNGTIETFAAKTEKLLAEREVDDLLVHLEKKPGVYARKLHEVLRKFPQETEAILTSFEQHSTAVALKNLLVMKAYFASINEQEHRTVINKKGKIKVLVNNSYVALSDETVQRVVTGIEWAIVTQLKERDSWEDLQVWIDPSLAMYTVPLQQRKASDGIITVGRGSRIAVDFQRVLRLFVYWKQAQQRTDLDLSVMQFDAQFNYVGHVSYTNLRSTGIAHSGDIQSAPKGAAEFIDITLAQLPKRVKYLAVQVYKYCGDNFVDIDCHAGWMMRQEVNPDVRTFDVKTVVNKFDLNGAGGYAIPMVVDLEAQEMIMTDLFVSGRAMHNNVEGASGDVSLICSQIASFVQTRPVVADLALAHVVARNATITDDRAKADITFGITGCTYNATDVEQLLSELI